MRADKNWEDPVGKKLFDYEGELSPQNWENIRKGIKPPRQAWRRWLWLPVLFLLIGVPATLYLRGKLMDKGPAAEIAFEQPPANPTHRISGSEENAKVTNPEIALNQPGSNLNRQQQQPENVSAEGENQQVSGFSPKPQVNLNPQILAGISKEEGKPNLKKRPLPESEDQVALNQAKTVAKNDQKPKLKGVLLAGQLPVKTAKTVPVSTEKLPAATTAKTARNKSAESINQPELAKSSGPPVAESREETANNEASAKSRSEAEIALIPENSQDPIVAKKEPGDVIGADSANVNPAIALAQVPADSMQQAGKEEPESGRFRGFAVYTTPVYTYQHVKANPNDEVMIVRMNNRNQFNSERFGFEVGFRIFYALTPKINLEGGAHFARIRQHLNFTIAGSLLDTIVTQQNGKMQLQLKPHETQETLLFTYYFGGIYGGGAWKVSDNWQLAGGLGANFMFGKTPDENTVPIKTNLLNPYLSTGLRYQFPLSPTVSAQVGPTIQYYLRPVQKSSAYYISRLTTFGFSGSIIFSGKNR